MAKKKPVDPQPMVQTFATVSAQNHELKNALMQTQMQAQHAMQMAAQERGKYLHVLKLFAAILEQNMQMNMPTVVLHKTLVDQPDTLNIARDEVEGGYAYRLVTQEEMEKAANDAAGEMGDGAGAEPSGSDPLVVAP